MNSTWAFIVVAMLMAAAHAAPLAQDSADDDDDDAIMNQILKRDADFRQDGFLGDVWNGIKTVASNAGQAALKALGEKEKAMLLKEIQELEKKNVRLNDAVLSRQNGVLANLWNGIKTVASDAGKAALKALGEEEKAMLLKEIQEFEKKNVRLNDAVLSRQNGVLANLWNGIKTVASDAGKAALKALGEEEKAMLLEEIKELKEKKNVRLDDAVMSRQDGFLGDVWNGIKNAGKAALKSAGSAALKALGEKEKAMLEERRAAQE